MRQLLGMVFVCGVLSLVGCQQTQEADDEPDTTVIEKETVVPAPAPADEPDVEMDVKMEGEGASGEVSVEEN